MDFILLPIGFLKGTMINYIKKKSGFGRLAKRDWRTTKILHLSHQKALILVCVE